MLFSCHALGVASSPSICRATFSIKGFRPAEPELESGFLVPSKANSSSGILEGTLIKIRPRAPETSRDLLRRDAHQTDRSSIRASDAMTRVRGLAGLVHQEYVMPS
ncbi:hypothetical protein CSIM01_08224 [Colletotrichum simmondsii]|uniref:Uncharacterized protein n=1 Tax=Colletotrichum simmondsii TaxID=703756 RepID=A0A135TTD3_9PEZI|nr:hypothetical protein CSIM01_08224 [Colletotrichum simmondsii]